MDRVAARADRRRAIAATRQVYGVRGFGVHVRQYGSMVERRSAVFHSARLDNLLHTPRKTRKDQYWIDLSVD